MLNPNNGSASLGGGGDGGGDVESNNNEMTALLPSSSGISSSGDDSPGTAESGDSDKSGLWQEMDMPWPATFERSISLLASPVIKADEAAIYTKSPKPGNTPLAIRRKMRPGNETPTGGLLPPLTRHKSIEGKITAQQQLLPAGARGEGGSSDFKAAKDNLLAQSTKLTSLVDTQKDQERKAKDAAEYRRKILNEKAREKKVVDDGYADVSSPSLGRERAAIKRSKQQKLMKKSESKQLDHHEKATFWQCVFNLANILMGVGLLGLPYAFAKAGLVGGLFSIVSLCFITWKTSIMIGRELNGDPRPASYFDDSPWKTPLQPGSVPNARMLKPISSFPDIARAAFGEVGCIILSVILYFELFSCISIFIVTIGDHMHTLFPSIPVLTHQIGVGFASAVPVLLLRTARLLSYLSMVGTFATICVVVAVILAFAFEGDITDEVAAKESPVPQPPYHATWHGSGLVLSFGLVAYCFSGHAIVPSIYSSMQKPQEFEKVVHLTFAIVLGACLAVGLSGYMMFGELVFDQITISLEQNSSAGLAMTILTYLMVLTAFSKLTLTMFPLAIGMEEIAAPYISSDAGMDIASAVIKVALLMMALAVAVFVPSFSFLCSLVGMICTMTVSVVFPAAAYLKLFGKKLGIAEKLMYWLFVVGGMVMAVAGTVLTVG